jgi:hypothetical protein
VGFTREDPQVARGVYQGYAWGLLGSHKSGVFCKINAVALTVPWDLAGLFKYKTSKYLFN